MSINHCTSRQSPTYWSCCSWNAVAKWPFCSLDIVYYMQYISFPPSDLQHPNCSPFFHDESGWWAYIQISTGIMINGEDRPFPNVPLKSPHPWGKKHTRNLAVDPCTSKKKNCHESCVRESTYTLHMSTLTINLQGEQKKRSDLCYMNGWTCQRLHIKSRW